MPKKSARKGHPGSATTMEVAPWRKRKYARSLRAEEAEWAAKAGPVVITHVRDKKA